MSVLLMSIAHVFRHCRGMTQQCARFDPRCSVKVGFSDYLARHFDINLRPSRLHCHVCVAYGLKGQEFQVCSCLYLRAQRLLTGELMNEPAITVTVYFTVASPFMAHNFRHCLFLCEILFSRVNKVIV